VAARRQAVAADRAQLGPSAADGDLARFRAAEHRIALASRLLDDLIVLPGGRRVGLEPILGLVPGLGDIVGGAAGFWLIAEATRFGVPRVVLVRMLVNTLLDLVAGVVPVLGDLFDFAFKSNARNLALFRRHALDPGARTTGSQAFLAGLALVFVGFVWLVIAALGWLLSIEIPAPSFGG